MKEAANEAQSAKENPKTKLWVAVAVAALVLIGVAVGAYWYTQVKAPHAAAMEDYTAAFSEYDAAAAELTKKNEDLSSKISELEALTTSGEPPLDPELLQTSGTVIGESQGAIVSVIPAPATVEEAADASTEEIKAFTTELNTTTRQMDSVPPYHAQIERLDTAISDLSDSIAQMAQVTDPPEQFVIERLTGLPNITGVQAATEDHDPNGHLHKQGGYTSAVFFSSDLVDRSQLFEVGDIVGTGTDGGGQVEVYANVADAEKRDAYISQYDGTVVNPGSHYVLGTCLVRVSGFLTATQQQTLQESIVESLTRLD